MTVPRGEKAYWLYVSGATAVDAQELLVYLSWYADEIKDSRSQLSGVVFDDENSQVLDLVPEVGLLRESMEFTYGDSWWGLAESPIHEELIIPLLFDHEHPVSFELIGQILRFTGDAKSAIACLPPKVTKDLSHVSMFSDYLFSPWLNMGGSIPWGGIAVPKTSFTRSMLDSKVLLTYLSQNAHAKQIHFLRSYSEPSEKNVRDWQSSYSALTNGRDDKKFRVTVLGTLEAYHHHKICFMNYFESELNEAFDASLVSVDSLADYRLIGSDLLIISRLYGDDFTNAVDAAIRLHIPTMYMLDDNWFKISREFPELYGEVFPESSPEMQTFISNLHKVDRILCYSEVLEEEFEELGLTAKVLKSSVDLEAFLKYPRPERSGTTIGYVGSYRFDDTAFRALASFAASHQDVNVVLMGSFSHEQLELFRNSPAVEVIPFAAYEDYMRITRDRAIDIFLAPLGSSRTEASKVANKYFEITAAGGVGVYSAVIPYTSVIIDGKNGYLVEDFSSERSWYRAIEKAYVDTGRQNVADSALRDVKTRFSVEAVAPDFFDFIETIAGSNQS